MQSYVFLDKMQKNSANIKTYHKSNKFSPFIFVYMYNYFILKINIIFAK